MSNDVPLMFFQIAGLGMGTLIICTIILKRALSPESEVYEQLFTRPMLGGTFQLRGRYFIPWARSPEFLGEESAGVQLLFWAARLGGSILVLGLAGFLASELYIGTIGRS